MTAPAPGSATALAQTNIALVKYWGKGDAANNVPATASLSLTLAELGTRTTVEWTGAIAEDEVMLGGRALAGRPRERVVRFLDFLRARLGIPWRARVTSTNTVPTGAGLASSASGFAALAFAATRAAGVVLGEAALSALARRGSASAARSIFGGFATLEPGLRPDGEDTVARPLSLPAGAPDVRLVVAVCGEGEKALSSTEGMNRTAATSPFYRGWLEAHAADYRAVTEALAARDLAAAGPVIERNALRMHAAALGADPPILYWRPATVAALEAVWALRAGGVLAFATIDAGPHVKVLCTPAHADEVAAALGRAPGVLRTHVCSPGPGARVEG